MTYPSILYDEETQQVDVPPFEPVEAQVGEDDGTIFVSIVSYRDGERCGQTLKSLFENAKDPDKVFVGLTEQNDAADRFCLEEYCATFGANTMKRMPVRKDVVKIVDKPSAHKKCPHYDQVRLVGLHHYAAKGPMYARSMLRKVLGNEEFCMQVDAHSDFVPNWDELAKSEWKRTRNEFAIISHLPEDLAVKSTKPQALVPRQCAVKIRENGFPDFELSPNAGEARDLDEPLLSYTWSAAFSFAKCHLEESAPYDPFAWFAMPIEQFSRMARFWTRGYDVYTPTKTIVYHDYEDQKNGHGDNEWFKRQRDRFRQEALARVKSLVQFDEGKASQTELANMGLYGLGKRRKLSDFFQFTGMSMENNKRKGNDGSQCGKLQYVPYDAKISPLANLYDKPDNLDPQPEYPLRTRLVFYEKIDPQLSSPLIRIGVHDNGTISELVEPQDQQHLDSFGQVGGGGGASEMAGKDDNLPSLPLLLLLWFFGLVVWCTVYMNPIGAQAVKRKIKKKVKEANFKDV